MKKQLVKFTLILADILFLTLVYYLSVYVRDVFDLPELISDIKEFYFIILIIFILMYYEGIYTYRYDFWQDTQKIFKSFVISYLVVLSILTLTKSNLEFSRSLISIYFIIGVFLLPVFKRIIKLLIYSFSFFKKRVLVVGSYEQVEVFKKEFDKNWYLGQVYAKSNFDSVIITTKGLSKDSTNSLVHRYLSTNSELYVVPYITDINFAHSNILEYSNIRYNAIEVENKLLSKKNIIIKTIFDRLVSVLLFPFFLLLHIFISLGIKIDSDGKIIFKQSRLGKDDVNIEVYKYRTMYSDADTLLENYLARNPDEVKHYERYHKYKNDPRITRFGKFLRTTSLDELPQLLNVIKGDMSLVGPRPYMLNESCKLGDDKQFVLKVKPGITGLWQVSGRNNLTFKERNKLEVWYIKNWSLWFDLVILIKTVKVVLSKLGAR